MMWLHALLVIFFALNNPLYWEFVDVLNQDGCRVYNDYFVSCPNRTPPLGAIPIPDDAVEVIPNHE